MAVDGVNASAYSASSAYASAYASAYISAYTSTFSANANADASAYTSDTVFVGAWQRSFSPRLARGASARPILISVFGFTATGKTFVPIQMGCATRVRRRPYCDDGGGFG